jgi:uncharacterized protein (DUF2141 family)
VKLSLVASMIFVMFYSSLAFSKKSLGILYIKIEKIKNMKGSLKIALIDKETNLGSKDDLKDAIRIDSVTVSGKSMDYQIKKIPYGKYSFIVFHDENNNEKLDLDLFEVPLEGFGYSGNPEIKKRRPTFKESSFEINHKKKSILIKMKYL